MFDFEMGSKRPARGVPVVCYVFKSKIKNARLALVERREFHCGVEALSWCQQRQRQVVNEEKGWMSGTAFIRPENDPGESRWLDVVTGTMSRNFSS